MNSRLVALSIIVCCLGLFAGCSVAPDYNRPATIMDVASQYTNSTAGQVDYVAPTYRWWENFADPSTSKLVQTALRNNYSLKSAAQRVLQSQAALEQTIGGRLPNINYSFSRDRNKSSFFLGDLNISSLQTVYTQGIAVSYPLDLFGKLKNASQAAFNDLLAVETTQIALTNSLIASVINSRVNIESLQRQLEIALQTIESRKTTLEIIERRYSNGRATALDVRLARENLASAQASKVEFELELAQALLNLDSLLAVKPGSTQNLSRELPQLPDLSPVPVGIPASLLDRRPDVVATELALKAQNQRVGISIAQLYPDFTLTGSYGFRSEQFKDAFNDDFEVYSLVTSLAAPIWQGGQLRANIRGSKARFEELAYDYADTVINALNEVETALITEEKLKEKYEFIKVQVEQAVAAQELSLQRYTQGLENILAYLEAERRSITAQNQLVNVKSRLWTNRVNLFLALGGNWTQQDNNLEEAVINND